MTIVRPDCAMLLAAGLGTRLNPLTLEIPKPLVQVAGRALIDRTIDSLAATNIAKIVVNLHHLGHLVKAHLERNQAKHRFKVCFSDEGNQLLESGGGVVKALPLLGEKPFFILNTDTFWQEEISNLNRLSAHFDPQCMDMLLLTVHREQVLPPPERGDFLLGENGHLTRATANDRHAVIYSGALITRADIFLHSKALPHSLNVYFDQAIKRGRLYGLPLQGRRYTVGTAAELATVSAQFA